MNTRYTFQYAESAGIEGGGGMTSSSFSAVDQGTETLVRAHQLVSPDLYVIQRLLKADIAPDYPALFGAQLQPKIAALALLVRQKLLDLHYDAIPAQELQNAREDLSSYVQILFDLHAAEALGIFYDLAVEYGGGKTSGLWTNVGSRCLYLLGLLPSEEQRALELLDTRPHALAQLDHLAQSANPEIAQPAKSLRAAYGVWHEDTSAKSPLSPPSPYVSLYQQYVQDVSSGENIGLSSWLTSKDRIEHAVMSGDMPTVVQWLSEGAPAALRVALRYAQSVMAPPAYIELLGHALQLTKITPQRQLVLLKEVSTLNQRANIPGGVPELNRILTQAAMSCDESMREIAQIAIQALLTVRAFKSLVAILEHATSCQVAEWALEALRDARQLQIAGVIVQRRPELLPSWRSAQEHLRHLRELADGAANCLSEGTAMVYLTKLKEYHAIEELRELSKQNTRTGELAKMTLAEIDPSLVVSLY